jgi:serine protease SohB
MLEFLYEYGLFFAKVITGLLALMIAMALIGGAKRKEEEGELSVTKLNDHFDKLKNQLLKSVTDKKEFKKLEKQQTKQDKKEQKSSKSDQAAPRVYVLDFEGDIKASEVATLRDEITAILSIARPEDEIVLCLENAGGVVHEHGLAASQLQRLKDAKLNLTVSVDKVAASGGYMMACVADKIIAAPFAIVGSIGVLAQLPNFNRLLDKHGIDFEQHTAGEYKRTVTMFGKNSDKEREKLKADLSETHDLFRDFVKQNRSKLDIDKVSTGEHWYGKQAIDLELVDELITSDEYLLKAADVCDVYKVKIEQKKSFQERFLGGLFASISKLNANFAQAQRDSRYL